MILEATQIVKGIDKQWILKASLNKEGQQDLWSGYDYSFYLRKSGLRADVLTINPMTRARFLQECEFIFREPTYAIRFLFNPTIEALERFAEEVKVLRELDDPRIVKIHDYILEGTPSDEDEEEPGYPPFYVTDLIQGETLKKLVEEDKAYEGKIDESLALMKEIGSALIAAHHAGIVHRELQPRNILVKEDESPVIIDFGICQFINGVCHILTGVDERPVNFMPPELLGGSVKETEIGPATDVYAFGKILYYLISGGEQLPGEDHHKEAYDLRKKYPTKQMDLVYRIFDHTICADLNERISTVEELMTLINKELVEGTRCVYCGIGGYQPLSQEFLKNRWKMGQFENEVPYDPRAFACNMCGNLIYFSDTRVLEDEMNA